MANTKAQRVKTNKYTRRSFLKTSALATAAVVFHGRVSNQAEPLVEILHLPKRFSRRYGEFTANISGAIAPKVKQLRYQLNNGEWLEFISKPPRQTRN